MRAAMWIKTIVAVLVRPWLWWTAMVQLVRMTPRGWWRRRPFLPVPTADYLEFRLVTQYGGDAGHARAAVERHDVVNYLEWCRAWNKR